MKKILLSLAISSCLLPSAAASDEDDNVVLGYSTLKNADLISLEPQLCVGPEGGFGYGAGLSLLTFKWRYFGFTALEFGHGTTGSGVYTYAGTRPVIPIHLSDNGRHQLRFGLGLDFAVAFGEMSGESTNGAGLFISPSVVYRYQTSGSFFISAGVSAFLFTAGDRQGYPFFLLASVGCGFAI